MSLAKLLNQPLQLQTVTQTTAHTDKYGNPSFYAGGSSTTVYGFLEQSNSVETLDNRDTVVSSWSVYLPADTTIRPLDRILFNGQTFEVDGEPWQVYNPRQRAVSHIQAKLKVVVI